MKMNVNPWVSMWTNPRKTIREIVNVAPSKGFYLLSVIFSFQYLLNAANSLSLGAMSSPTVIIITSLILSSFVGVLLFYLSSFCFYWTGKLFHGISPFQHIRASVAWSTLPYMINIIMWFIFLATSAYPAFVQVEQSGIPYIFISVINIIVAIWSIVLMVSTLKEVQDFSYLKAIGNYLAGMIVYFIILFIIFYGLMFSTYVAARFFTGII